jgi:hypothetical protein
MVKLLAGTTILLSLFTSALRAEPTTDPSGIAFELSSTRPRYLLGENATVRFSTINTSKAPLIILDFGNGAQYQDSRVSLTALDSGGASVPELPEEVSSHDNLAEQITVAPGGRWSIDLDVAAYCWIEQPGTYTFRVAPTQEFPLNPAVTRGTKRGFQCTITFEQPTQEQASGIFEQATRSDDLLATLQPMREATYGPFIASLKPPKDHANYIAALSACYFPEVSATLIKVAGEESGDNRSLAVQALLERMPSANPYPEDLTLTLPRPPDSLRAKLAAQSWHPAMVASMRKMADIWLTKVDLGAFDDASRILELVGQPADAPFVAVALDRILSGENPKNGLASFYTKSALLFVCSELVSRGYTPPAHPRTLGEIAFYLEALQWVPSFRPQGWELFCDEWSKSTSSTIRGMANTVRESILRAGTANASSGRQH